MAPTAAQMPRSIVLAMASSCFRNVDQLKDLTHLSNNGNEVCFCTIGDASTSEGHFWETVNAAAVLQVPLAIFIWDDGYGISVPKKYQTTKGSISEALSGMQKEEDTNGINIYRVKAWDYAGMCEVFEQGIEHIRQTHTPALFHVEEVTQPQGHSTSGSHERYKSAERLEWEREWDCIKKMKEWLLANDLALADELEQLELDAKKLIRDSRAKAWEDYQAPILTQVKKATELLSPLASSDTHGNIKSALTELAANREPLRKDVVKALSVAKEFSGNQDITGISNFLRELKTENEAHFNSFLYNSGDKSALKVKEVKPEFTSDINLNGYEILNRYFDALFGSHKTVFAFGEDLGSIGDVNQGFAGLQAKHGKGRIFDTGIRELTIMGQGVGMALRGLRPIAEIQYLDYVLYGLQVLSDDLASLHYRTAGQQSCPMIIRTRGHRLEGIWHSGSPLGMIINSLRGIYICVPRNMVQAAGMYNTLLQGNDPGLVIECLNGYRLKERLPSNLLELSVPLGIPEIIRHGTDVTVVSYGSTLRIVQDAASRLEKLGISLEIMDVQTLLPFDIEHRILESLKKTNRILFVDEDVPGGAAAYMFNHVMEQQGGYRWLDAAPKTLTGKAHRPAYGSDGDYFSKPNAEDVVSTIQGMMAE
jgi:pyruvate/2-oxoglutarate/acetoin dehydrogenase E1 component